MKKKAVVAASILSLFILFLAETLFISLVSANFTPLPELPPPIYIRNDGSVEPSTAPIQRAGNTYTFIGNINNTVEVQRSNILIDGNGFVLTKPAVNTEGLMMPIGWLPGVHVVDTNDITITNIAFEGCITGVTVENASSITISQNTIRETKSGIVVLSSSEINIIDNDITLSNQSFATGIHFLPSDPEATDPYHITIRGNRITGTSTQVPASPPQPEQYGIWGGFGKSQMTGNSLSGIKGIALYYTGSNNLISGNNFQNNYEGIFFTGSPEFSVNNTIYGNNFKHNSENAVVPYIRDQPLNFWDNGTVGNYWSDYTGVDNNGDGIGDTPYEIAINNVDNYPLMTETPVIPEFPLWVALPPLMAALLLTSFVIRKNSSNKKKNALSPLLCEKP